MRKDQIVVSVLSFLAMAAVIGLNVLVSCLLALGIVLAYGLSLKLLLRDPAGHQVAVTVTSAALALATMGLVGGLVFLWSLALARPFLWSLSLWSAILASGATWALLASWFEERHRGSQVLRGILS